MTKTKKQKNPSDTEVYLWREYRAKLPKGFHAHIDSLLQKWEVIYKYFSDSEPQKIVDELSENQAKIIAANLNLSLVKKTRLK